MPRAITFAVTDQPAGRYDFGPANVPQGITGATARIDRTTLPPTARLDWALELSRDDGATWLPWGGAGTVGGDVIDPDTGLPATESSFSVGLPEDQSASRRVRGSVTINERLTTSVAVDVT